jgi:hypothetical protein
VKKLLVSVCVVLSLVVPTVSAFALDAILTWTNSSSTHGIQIERSATIGGTYSVINQTAANVSTYTDSTNIAGTTSCYRIAYFNTSGVGPYTTPYCKSFPVVPTQLPGAFAVN